MSGLSLSQVPSARGAAIRVAKHELGHLVAARACGFKTGECTVKLQFNGGMVGHHGTSEIILIEPLTTPELLNKYLKRRIVVLFAGVLAESLKETNEVDDVYAVKELESGGATTDFKVVSELRWILRNLCHPVDASHEDARDQAAALQSELWQFTATFVQDHAPLICGLAARLACRITHFNEVATLTAQEIDAAPAMQAFMRAYSERPLHL
jgi:hypothetical protein